ncbi:hypothetical protein EJB05_33084, partial [Eragrostis curvula]
GGGIARLPPSLSFSVVNIRTVHRDSFTSPPTPAPASLSAPVSTALTAGRASPPTESYTAPEVSFPSRSSCSRRRARPARRRRPQDLKYQFNSIMVLDALSSPHRRSQNTFFMQPSKKPQSSRDEVGSWSALMERHRFLLTTLVVLAFLCMIYLYFAVTLGAPDGCSGLADTERDECLAKSVMLHGKLKLH